MTNQNRSAGKGMVYSKGSGGIFPPIDGSVTTPQPPDYLETSSRIQRWERGEKSAGASCNTFVIQDTMESITEAWAWSGIISQLQGAPTMILSNIRGKGSAISSGGYASGPCSFAKVFDVIAGAMLRPGKKNGVVVLFLDADHPDLDEWLSPKFKGTLERAFTGVLLQPGKVYSDETLSKIAHAYDNWHLSFVCKTTLGDNGETLYPNVCTEIRQGHKGQCILGAIKLHEMGKLTPFQIVQGTKDAATKMASYLSISKENADTRPDLFAYEPQVGLGFVGMANFIGTLGATYQGIVSQWSLIMADLRGMGEATDGVINIPMDELLTYLYYTDLEDCSPESKFWLMFVSMIATGDEVASIHGVARLWTAQPTNHTSLRMGQITEMANVRLSEHAKSGHGAKINKLKLERGITGVPTQTQAIEIMDTLQLPLGTLRRIDKAVAAELQPPMAVRTVKGSSAIQQSELTGNTELNYPASVQTRDEVPYETYRGFCDAIQSVMNINGKCHTFSHNVYADKVDLAFIKGFIKSPIGSLYYRLPPAKAQALSKESTWDGTDISDLFDDEPDMSDGYCPIDGSCESCSM